MIGGARRRSPGGVHVIPGHRASRRSFLKWSDAAPWSLSASRSKSQAPFSIVVDAACPLVHPGRGEKAFSEYLDQMLRGGVGLATHSNAWSLCHSKRNIKDDQIEAVARKGGVIGLTSFSYFLTKEGQATVDHYLDHVDYLVRRVGVDHVAVGLDLTEGRVYGSPLDPILYEPEAYPPLPWQYARDLESVAEIANLTGGLVERGYAAEDIRKILGGNWIRVYREVLGK